MRVKIYVIPIRTSNLNSHGALPYPSPLHPLLKPMHRPNPKTKEERKKVLNSHTTPGDNRKT